MEAARRYRLLRERGRRFVTTSYVASETYTALRAWSGHSAALAFLAGLRAGSYVQRLSVPAAWEVAAEELLAQRADQPLSYVDATSFIAMERLGIREAFAFDRHFAAMGFTVVDG